MVVGSGSNDITKLFKEGLNAHNSGKLKTAKNLYHKILSIKPDHPEANHNIGILLIAQKKFDKALKFFKLALSSSPNVSLFWASYIDALVKLERITEAKDLIKAAEKSGLACENIKAISERLRLASKLLSELSTETFDTKISDEPSTVVIEKFSIGKVENEVNLSICIPTYNRARYLEVLLQDLYYELSEFPFSYEIVISNNCSEDNTEKVIKKWADKLPIVYVSQEINIGALNNIAATYAKASGTFALYLADDDFIEKDGLTDAISMLIAQPDAVVLYAPQKIIEFQNKKSDLLFYTVPEDIIIEQFDYVNLLKLILENHIFPEIMIIRLSIYKTLIPDWNDLAFWAFTKATEWLSVGKVIFKKDPFYCFSTRYFRDEKRLQAGNEEVEYAWDRYRGGLEHMLSFAKDALTEQDQIMFKMAIQKMVVDRMLVGLRCRLSNNRNPVDSYYLAARICSMVDRNRLPADYDLIRTNAAVWFIGNDMGLLKNKEAIIMIGFDENSVQALRKQSILPVLDEQVYSGDCKNLVVLHTGNLKNSKYGYDLGKASNNTILTEEMIMNKFK